MNENLDPTNSNYNSEELDLERKLRPLSFDDFSVIASGGISSMQDLEQLARYEEKGLDGAIIGKALYNGTLNLKAVLKQFSS